MSFSQIFKNVAIGLTLVLFGWFASGLYTHWALLRSTNTPTQAQFQRGYNEGLATRIQNPKPDKPYLALSQSGEMKLLLEKAEKNLIWAKHPVALRSEVIQELGTDWSQINLTFRRSGESSAEVNTLFKQIDTDLRATLDRIGLQDTEIKMVTREVKEEPAKDRARRKQELARAAERCRQMAQAMILKDTLLGQTELAECKETSPMPSADFPAQFFGETVIVLIYPGTTRFTDLLIDPETPQITEAATPRHWFDNENAVLQPLKDKALADIVKQAKDIDGVEDVRVEKLTFDSTLEQIKGYKYNTTPIRVKLTAIATVRYHRPIGE